MRALALVAIAACGSPAPAVPKGRPVVRLVRCAAASPPPQLVAAAQAAEDDTGVQFTLASRRAVSLGAVTSTGDTDKIAVIVRGKLGALTQCYADDGPAKLAIVYRIAIASDGKVSKVDTTATISDASLDACVKRVLGSAAFGPQRGAVVATVPIVFDSTGTFTPPAKPVATPGDPALAWTPFAIDSNVQGVAASGAARLAESAMRGRVATIDACFGAAAPTGSLRVMLEVGVSGELDSVRAGGLGDAAGEACVSRALADMRVVAPMAEHLEIACDFARGDAHPWRVARTAYPVIEADRAQLRHGAVTVVPGASDPPPLPIATYLVVAKPDTPGALLQLALLWAGDARAVVVALDDGNPAPLFLGLGQTTVGTGDDAADDVARPALRVNKTTVAGCVGRTTHTAKLADPASIGSLVQRIATKCRSIACSHTLLVAIDSDAVARDLVEVTGAARRAGYDRVLLGGSELGCQAAGMPKPDPPSISGPDDE